jgi:lipopolysaccharide export system protein LptA
MTIPALSVKGITLTKSGNTITGKLEEYKGSVKNAKGEEKIYTISKLTVIFSDKTVVMTFTMNYGNMPFAFEGQFTGTKK